jgi:hypothetical protein
MLTRQIDAAVHALDRCRERVPFLRDRYGEGSPERAALDEVLASLRRADEVLFASTAAAPAEHG